MYLNLLKKFFKDNSARESTPTAPALIHFTIKLSTSDNLKEDIEKIVDELSINKDSERKNRIISQKREIENAISPEQLIQIIRRKPDPMNRNYLVDKALTFGDELIIELINRLKTSLNSCFIECTALILARCEMDIAEVLVNSFDEIRNPYAQGMVLVVLGFKADETIVPWLIDKYKVLQRNYPEESYYEGAYYGLSEIFYRYFES